jgi:hypothetical protein
MVQNTVAGTITIYFLSIRMVFWQWKDAALLTLAIVKKSIQHGMILKDATLLISSS